MSIEIEAKIRVAELGPVAARLRKLGGVDQGVVFERNIVLDDPGASLRRRGALLRVRTVDGRDEAVLTIKQTLPEPVEAMGGGFKTREEIETIVNSADRLIAQLAALGFAPTRMYEKIRHSWLWRDCAIALDQLPEIGCFVEIEGEADAIVGIAADLGLDPDAHIGDNYLGLWDKHVAALGQSGRDMVFPPDHPARR